MSEATKRPALAWAALRYAHLPQILPRIQRLHAQFGRVAYLFALIFGSARLLPDGHPMLNPANIGRYSMREVLAETANRIEVRWSNCDQIAVYLAVIFAFVLVVVQSAAIGFYALMSEAQAAASPAGVSLFASPGRSSDIVLQFLGSTFGFQSIFYSGLEQAGLYALLRIYSTAMMVLATMIVLYYVVTVVGETAQSGTPFGRRFNGLWAPIRLVLALGLLVPLGSGVNAGQYLTLYVAKFGSGLATQAWVAYVKAFTTPTPDTFAASSPSVQAVADAVVTAEACRSAYNALHTGSQVQIVASNGRDAWPATFTPSDLERAAATNALSYTWAVPAPGLFSAGVDNTCGSISMPMVGQEVAGTDATQRAANAALRRSQSAYLALILEAVKAVSGDVAAIKPGSFTSDLVAASNEADPAFVTKSKATLDDFAGRLAPILDTLQTALNDRLAAVDWSGVMDAGLVARMQSDASLKGWGTAGAYYMQMAKVAQLVRDTAGQLYPAPVMEPEGITARAKTASGLLDLSSTDARVRNVISSASYVSHTAATRMKVYSQGVAGKVDDPKGSFSLRAEASLSTMMRDPVMWLAGRMFGDAFFKMIDGGSTAPMVSLIQGGTDILTRSRELIGYYTAALAAPAASRVAGKLGGAAVGAGAGYASNGWRGALGGAAVGFIAGGGLGDKMAQVVAALSGFMWLFIVIGVGAGIVLFYLLPLMPFMYFFFSVVNWVIEVAEAFISMPLFALAHLRIDGEGMPGQTAMQGWLTLFGVLLRPVMIVGGLVVGTLVFGAGVSFLNATFKYAIAAYNVEGGGGLDFTKISGFGLITYTLIYVYMVYMLGNSTFKLIDAIPDKMMRWVGGASPFTGDRPVDIGKMQGVALLGFGAVNQVHGAAGAAVTGLSKIRARASAGTQESPYISKERGEA